MDFHPLHPRLRVDAYFAGLTREQAGKDVPALFQFLCGQQAQLLEILDSADYFAAEEDGTEEWSEAAAERGAAREQEQVLRVAYHQYLHVNAVAHGRAPAGSLPPPMPPRLAAPRRPGRAAARPLPRTGDLFGTAAAAVG